jgi:hypothetical protein
LQDVGRAAERLEPQRRVDEETGGQGPDGLRLVYRAPVATATSVSGVVISRVKGLHLQELG